MPSFVNCKKGALDHGWWFSPGTPASSTTKTGRHDIAEILLKVASNTKIQSNQIVCKQETLRAKKWCFLWSIFILPPILMICYVKLNDDGQNSGFYTILPRASGGLTDTQKPGCISGHTRWKHLSPHETHDVADELWLGYHVLSTLHRDRQIRLHDLRNNYKTTSSITRMTHRGYQPRYCPTHGQVAPQQNLQSVITQITIISSNPAPQTYKYYLTLPRKVEWWLANSRLLTIVEWRK